MKRHVAFWVAFAYLVGLLVVGLLFFVKPEFHTWLPATFGPVPVGVPWFGALGAVLLSLKGIFDHEHDWDESFWPWHASRPFIGASVGVVGVLILQAGILAVGSDPTPSRPALTGQPVATPTGVARPAASPEAAVTPVVGAEPTPGTVVAIPANLLYYLVAFLVGYREETFRTLLRRLTDVILAPGDEKKTPPTVVLLDPKEAPSDKSTPVKVIGSVLTNTQSVKFGGAAARFDIDSDSQITAHTPPASTPGAVSVTVTTDGGTATLYPFTFTAAVGPAGILPEGDDARTEGGGPTETSSVP